LIESGITAAVESNFTTARTDKTMSMTFPREPASYREARERLLEQEIALRRAMESVAEARRRLPAGGLVPEDYVFEGAAPDGSSRPVRLSELFAPGKDSLVIYNFMFPRYPTDDRPGPTTGATAQLKLEEGPCPSCTAFLDQLDGAAGHVGQRVNFVAIAKAPLPRLLAFAQERGWRNLRLLSSAGNNFKRDYHAESADGAQLPMLTVFRRDGKEIRHFWSSEMLQAPADPGQDPRHAGTIEAMWNIFDLTPDGRGSDWHEQLDYDCCSAGHEHAKAAS
jgi:predicted dithiol-disulfide oxidoreductase (DUF899 family)